MGCDCNNNGAHEVAWFGGGAKFAVNMTCEGFDMNEDDWTITVTRGSKSIQFDKDTAIYDGEGQWYICIDTELLGQGLAMITFEALVPDTDFPSGFRKEIQKYPFINIKQ